ncbi:hypothetical protein JHK82_046169 [Glycine max]|nr:hypothetical protein JHK82_046169 [Glycine max]
MAFSQMHNQFQHCLHSITIICQLTNQKIIFTNFVRLKIVLTCHTTKQLADLEKYQPVK